jgi:hypothetical protein
VVHPCREPEFFEQRPHESGCTPGVGSQKLQRGVLYRAGARQQFIGASNDPEHTQQNLGVLLFAQASHVAAADSHYPAVRRLEPGDQIHQR